MTEHDFGFQTDFYTFAPETLAKELPDFEILREVGKGSMGIVYEARRRADGKRVALKVLPPSLTLTDRALARFVKEGEVMSRVRHPSIVRVFEHGQKGRLHFFAMEFVEGITLEERVKIGPMPVRTTAEIGLQIAEALQYAHDHGVLHRDVKPGNLILREDGSIAITDFGLARETGTGSFTESGAIVGTPMYMAPEQILGHRGEVDSRVDVYGLGTTLYELVTGQPAFAGPTAQSILRAVLEVEPVAPRRRRQDLPEPLQAIILEALEKSPARRYGSAAEMAEDLRRFLDGKPVQARRPSPAQRMWRAAVRRPLLTALVLIILSLGLVAVFLMYEREVDRLGKLLDRAELHLTRATSLQTTGLRPPTAKERREFLEAAKLMATEVILEDSNNHQARMTRAKIHHSLHQYGRALLDLDRAEEILGEPVEELLHYRIDTLRQLGVGDSASMRRLGDDVASLLRLNQGRDPDCVVADLLLRMAAELQSKERDEILGRVEKMLARITTPNGPSAIARAELLALRSQNSQAEEATRKALADFPGNPMVRAKGALIFRRLGLVSDAQREESMARLLRGEEQQEHPAQEPETHKSGQMNLDLREFQGFFQRLDNLLSEALEGEGSGDKGEQEGKNDKEKRKDQSRRP